MCGICGYIAPNSKTRALAKTNFSQLLLASASRGTDASGFACVDGIKAHRLVTHKKNKPAGEFIKNPVTKTILSQIRPVSMIGHARAQTQGDAKENANNHPVVDETGLALVHNGIIYNDTALFEKHKMKREAEVDSEIIVRLIAHYKTKKRMHTISAIKKAVKSIQGTMACAMIDKNEPTALFLWVRGNPCTLAYHKPSGIMYFASTEEILKEALVKGVLFFNWFREKKNDEFIFKDMDLCSGVKITPQGVTDTFELDTYDYSVTNATPWTGTSLAHRTNPAPKGFSWCSFCAVTHAKKHYKCQFDVRITINKPSEYSLFQLNSRYDFLIEHIGNRSPYDYEQSELNRLNNAILDRQGIEDDKADEDFEALKREQMNSDDGVSEPPSFIVQDTAN